MTMTLLRKHFSIRDDQMEKILKEIEIREPIQIGGNIKQWSESDIVREALDLYFEKKGDKK